MNMRILISITILTCSMVACTGNSASPPTLGADTAVADVHGVAQDTITIVVNGDMMLGSTYPASRKRLAPKGGRDLLVATREITRQADVACGNLEGVLADSGRARKDSTSSLSFSFMMPTSLAAVIADAGYDFLSLANNHAYDFGEAGLRSTMRTLDAHKIAYAGARSLNPATEIPEFVVRQISGHRIAFCAFGHEVYSHKIQHLDQVKRIVAEAARQADIVIVSFHGGAEGLSCVHTPMGREVFYGDDRGDVRLFARTAVDAGADLVFGHGPHVPRGMELYRNRLIAYSLGNFCTLGMGLSGALGYAPLLRVNILSTGDFAGGQIHSFIQLPYRGPQPDASAAAVKLIRKLSEADFTDNRLEITDNGKLVKR